MSLPLSTSPQARGDGRTWRNMANVIERLAFMSPFNIDTRPLCVLLTLGEAGGEMTFERLRIMSGVTTALVLRSILMGLEEPGVNEEGSLTVSADGATVTLTNSGREACMKWNLPLNPLNVRLSLGQRDDEPDSLAEREMLGLEVFP